VREDAAVQAREQELDRLHTRARGALRERVRPQEHRRTHDLRRVGVADAAGVTSQEPDLQLLRELLGDRTRDEPAEARVDAVRVLARPVRDPFHELARSAHLVSRALRKLRARALECDRPDVADAEVVAGQADRGRLRHAWPV
jgi:hypothetical protein